MADISVQMPSDDEDFNATPTTVAPTEPAATESAPAAPVATSETPDFSKPAEAAVEPETPAPAESSVTEAAPVVADKPKVEKGPRKSLPVWPIVTAVLVLALIGLGLFTMSVMNDKKDVENKLAVAYADPQSLVKKQTDDLIAKVGSLMKLPAGETPTVANVSDATKAKQQSAFFANAQNGDRVLMYVKAGEAILYRPSTNKIILVAPLTFNNSTAATTPATTTTKK